MIARCVVGLQLCMILTAASYAGDRYLYSDGQKAYFCEPPASYQPHCYVVRDNTSVVRVNDFPVISSEQATGMIRDCSPGVEPILPPTGSIAGCCGGAPTGDCTCKNGLHCELTLNPANCQQTGDTVKKPRPYQVIGTIPMQTTDHNCLVEKKRFNYPTLVPTIICSTVTCTEIGTKTIECAAGECRPGCSFNVCVPINDCVTKKVECKLVNKEMQHIIFERTDRPNGPVVYDVYVINAPNGPLHAGGMPTEWVIMHCASKAQVQAKFPNMLASNKGKNIKSKTTEADVNIELAIDQEQLKKYIAELEASQSSDPEAPETSPQEASAKQREARASGASSQASSLKTSILDYLTARAG